MILKSFEMHLYMTLANVHNRLNMTVSVNSKYSPLSLTGNSDVTSKSHFQASS